MRNKILGKARRGGAGCVVVNVQTHHHLQTIFNTSFHSGVNRFALFLVVDVQISRVKRLQYSNVMWGKDKM